MERENRTARRLVEVVGRTPVFTGTRVPCGVLLEYLQGGHSLDTFLADFPSIRRHQAIGVLEIAKHALRRAVQ